MALFWKPDDLKELNKKKRQEQTRKDEISEIQDALMEIAEIVTTMAPVADEASGKDGETNG